MPPAGHTTRSSATVALLLVQLVVGYEWLVSGLTKIAHGDFPAGLADRVVELAKGSPAWYGDFLTGTVAPHASVFAYAIEWSELAAGLSLITAAATALRPGAQPSRREAIVTVVAAVVGLVLAVNFELSHGGTFGTRLASDSFDEGIDLDTIMVALQLALLVPAVSRLRRPLGRRGAWSSLRPLDHSTG